MTDEQRRADLAYRLDLLTEGDFILLAGVKAATVDAWRRRGTGPDFVRLGANVFYPRTSVLAYIVAKTKRHRDIGDVL